MGLSNEEAQHYSNEYNNGNTVVTVQVQSAQESEAQVKSAREEREKRLNEHKQQLQDLQSELQNILAELRDTQSRIGQYQ